MIHVQYTPLEEVQTWDRNPKDHDIGQLHQSMERWGYVQPILIDEGSNMLVAGHGRLEALTQMRASRLDPPNGVKVDPNGGWQVPVIRGVTFENKQEAEAYGVADNRLVILGGWDDAKLSEILSDLAEDSDQGLSGTGYDNDDLDNLLAQLNSDSVFEGGLTGDASAEKYDESELRQLVLLMTMEEYNETIDMLVEIIDNSNGVFTSNFDAVFHALKMATGNG